MCGRFFTMVFLDTLLAFSPTNLPRKFPYDPKEMLVFSAMGIACGLLAAIFIGFHRTYLRFVRENVWLTKIWKRGFFIYPTIVVFVIASLRCPLGYGQFFAGGLTPREALDELFCNFSWNDPIVMNSTYGAALMDHWSGSRTSIFLVLALYALNNFWMTAVANTLPVPCGIFIPVFVTGAAFGRICGEAMAIAFPTGLRADGLTKIAPGAYAVVGATAFAGGITHAISSSVIVLEITGQMRYVLPCTLAVLLAIAVCAHFQPSIYDSIIKIKKLPYLPRIPPTSSNIHRVTVANIMVRYVHYISLETTYKQLKYILEKMPKLRAFPLVDRPSSLILLGSISRSELEKALDDQIGSESWQYEYARRHSEFSLGTTTNTKINSVTPSSGERTKLLQSFFKAKSQMLRKAKSDEELHQVKSSQKSSTIRRARSRSGSESMKEKYSTRPSTPTLKRAWEIRVNSVGAYMSSLSNKLRQSFGFMAGSTETQNTNNGVCCNARSEWEESRLNQRLNFDYFTLDPAPFQLVECTSLYKVHSLFSLLGLNRAYVTCLGRLVGVVALRELRAALERAQNHDSNFDHMDAKEPPEKSFSDLMPGISLGAAVITPADVVRKISGHIPPSFRSDNSDDASQSSLHEAPCALSIDEESKNEVEDVAVNEPNEYYYTFGAPTSPTHKIV